MAIRKPMQCNAVDNAQFARDMFRLRQVETEEIIFYLRLGREPLRVASSPMVMSWRIASFSEASRCSNRKSEICWACSSVRFTSFFTG